MKRVVAVTGNVPPKDPAALPAPYIPFAGDQVAGESWYGAFLSDLAINGGMSLAAAAAGVHSKTVRRAVERDPLFAAEVEIAKEYYRDLLEWESVNLARRKNNPLPYFARLKAELPTRYIDRQAVLLAATPIGLSAEDGRALLQSILGPPDSPSALPMLEAEGARPPGGDQS